MIGSEAEFGGRKNYFTQHGNYEIWDYNTAIETGKIPPEYRVFWGYEDEKLFEYSKEKLTELSMSGQPFNFTMLTVDTHFEDGYVCPQCIAQYGSQYANVISCASHQVAEFVSWIQQQPFYANTTIIITGDHLTMQSAGSNFFYEIDPKYDRRIYNAIINPAVLPVNSVNREFNTMDMFPTTLASLGVNIEGNYLGLGVNLFSDQPTISEQYGRDMVNKELQRGSSFFDNFTKRNCSDRRK